MGCNVNCLNLVLAYSFSIILYKDHGIISVLPSITVMYSMLPCYIHGNHYLSSLLEFYDNFNTIRWILNTIRYTYTTYSLIMLICYGHG